MPRLIFNKLRALINHKRVKLTLVIIFTSLFLVFFFYQRHYQDNFSYLTGDEPHYIMMTDSLVKDGDFNLKNDYELRRAGNYFPSKDLLPQLSPIDNLASSKWYPIHTVGLPLLISLPYALFGVHGVRIFMIMLEVGSVVAFYLILKKYIKSQRQRQLGLALLLTCSLFWQNLGSVFPDLILITMWGSLILLFGKKSRISNLAFAAIYLTATLVHPKALTLITPLFIFHVAWLVKEIGPRQYLRKYWLSIGLLLVGLLASTRYLYYNYGIFSPTQLYGSSHSQLFAANPIVNLIAILTDRNKGLFIYFPLLALAGPYLVRLSQELFVVVSRITKRTVKLSKEHFLLAGLTFGLGSLLVTLLGFEDWSGSAGPNGRTTLPFIFVFIFVVSKYVNLRNRFEVFLIAVASVISGCLSWLSIVVFPYYMNPGTNSPWVDRFQPLTHLPMFNLIAKDHGHDAIIRGAEILLLVVILNVALIVIYRYKIIFQARKRNE